MPTTDMTIEDNVLLRLYAGHSALFAFTTSENITRYLEKLLNTIPGVIQSDVSLIETTTPSDQIIVSKFIGNINLKQGKFNLDDFEQLCASLEKKDIQVYPVRTADVFYGIIALKVSDSEKFQIFDPVVNTFAISVSIILENKFQKNMLEESNKILSQHKQHLSDIVQAQTISLNKANKEIQSRLDKTVEAVALITEQRDPYTAGHQFRVATLAETMAQRLGLSPEQTHEVYLGALIHDIGKIQVPAEILISPIKLTKLEFEFIKTHPEAGYKIAQSVPFNKTISDILLHHHERLDGSGYPHGLTDKEILFTTKIVSVADVFEAMSSHRPYRPKRSLEETLDELTSGAGKRYDLSVVECCIYLITKEGFKLPVQPYFNMT
ncbi:MAG: HD-GYP domain-containing protein [Gammaproteobacteria bacterium]|nr:HD-GYP domain-containing protein [Gammaproteobacteria bacterium]